MLKWNNMFVVLFSHALAVVLPRWLKKIVFADQLFHFLPCLELAGRRLFF